MSTVLSQMGALLRTIPAPAASVEETAAWYERKADLFDHIAAEAGTTAAAAHAAAVATTARAHARRLRRERPDTSAPPAA